MIASLIIISVLFFLLLLLVIAGFLLAIFMVMGGFQKQVSDMSEAIPLNLAPQEMVREAFKNKSGDDRFTTPVTMAMPRTDVQGEANDLETDAGEWK